MDENLVKLLPPGLRIEKVKAFRVTKPRIIGDIGLRAFFQLYRRAKKIINHEKIDFLYIPIPSFYCAMLGRLLRRATGIRYGIDYIDPWVHEFPGSQKLFSRHWLSSGLARFMEPIAVKKASLITGVAEGYYLPVLERNPHLKKEAVHGAMPYGGEPADHEALKYLGLQPYLFEKKPDLLQLVYAGAMLPKAYGPLEAVFSSIAGNRDIFEKVKFHFIGTGSKANDSKSYTIKPLAEKYGLWNTIVYEYPKRIPYLEVLIHLREADGIFILGSTEPHYTPSKIYQAVLSGKPILSVLHSKSTAVKVIMESGAGMVLDFGGSPDLPTIEKEFPSFFSGYLAFRKHFDPSQINEALFEKFSATSATRALVKLLNDVILKKEEC